MIVWPLKFKTYHLLDILLLLFIFGAVSRQIKAKPQALLVFIAVLLIAGNPLEKLWSKTIYTHRNYYGLYRLMEEDGVFLKLYNGTTLHGVQYLNQDRANEPLSYYHRDTLVGEFWIARSGRSRERSPLSG